MRVTMDLQSLIWLVSSSPAMVPAVDRVAPALEHVLHVCWWNHCSRGTTKHVSKELLAGIEANCTNIAILVMMPE